MVTLPGRWSGLGRSVLGLWLLVAAAPAQAAALRIAHPGRVLAADGAPVVGAAVTFVSVEGHGEMRDEDLVHATSDANGRYRVQLLPTRSYTAWATQATAAGVLVSAAVPRRPLQTELQFGKDGEVAQARWQLEGCEAWRAAGPLRVQLVVAGSEQLVPPATPDAQGTVPLPQLPRLPWELRVFCADRLVHVEGRHSWAAESLPPPHRIALRVVDEKGKPVVGAAVDRLAGMYPNSSGPFPAPFGDHRYPVAVTDAQGKAEALVASLRPPEQGVGYPPVAFVATKPGHEPAVSGYTSVRFENGERVAPNVLAVLWRTKRGLQFRLPTLAPGAGRRVALPDPHAPLVRFGRVEFLPFDAESGTSVWHAWTEPVEKDHTVALPSRREDDDGQLLELARVLAPVAADDPFRRAVTPRPLVVPMAWLDADQGLDLRKIQALRLQLVDATGGPAIGAQVLLGPAGLDPCHAMRAETDATGRVVFPTLPGKWIVAALAGATFGSVVVDVGASPDVVTLPLGPLDRMRVRVIDGEGKPLAGVRFFNTGASWSGGGDAEQQFRTELGHQLGSWLLSRASTGPDGCADLPFVACKSLRMEFQAHHGEVRGSELTLVAGDEVTEIELK